MLWLFPQMKCQTDKQTQKYTYKKYMCMCICMYIYWHKYIETVYWYKNIHRNIRDLKVYTQKVSIVISKKKKIKYDIISSFTVHQIHTYICTDCWLCDQTQREKLHSFLS